MPFSSQPRKKASASPQGAQKKEPSCGHSTCGASCSSPQKKSPTSKTKLVDVAQAKREIADFLAKIAEKTKSDKRFSEKSAFVLSQWIKKTK